MENIVILGAGGFGRDTKTIIDAVNAHNKQYKILGYYDDGKAPNSFINDLPVLGNFKDLLNTKQPLNVAIAIANPKIREFLAKQLMQNSCLSFPNLIHPNNLPLADRTVLGIGNIICNLVGISCNINFENFIIINTLCSVGHDCKVKDFVSLMPGVNISGDVTLHKNVYVGVGATVINQVSVGANTIVGAGAVVVSSIPENVTVVGVPAKALNK